MNLSRLFRFKLRTLLIAFTLSALAIGWHARGARLQHQAVETIFDHGGWAGYDFQERAGAGWLYAGGESRVPEWLIERVGVDFFHPVVVVKLPVVVDPGVTVPPTSEKLSEIMAQVARLRRLKTLWLADNFATDDALSHVARMDHIQQLWLCGYGHFSSEGLEQVSHIDNVHVLSPY